MSLYFRMSKQSDIQPVAARQAGRITYAQLRVIGVSHSTIRSWVDRGWLIPVLPGVYAVAYVSTTREAHLWDAVLYAGPGAMLSHMTAAQHDGLIKFAPETIHVSTPRKIPSREGIEVHSRRKLIRITDRGVPIPSVEQMLIDLARARPDLLGRALAQLDFQNRFEPDLIAAAARRQPMLRAALNAYDPATAALNDEFEIDFYAFCVQQKIEPLPIPNVELEPGLTVDGLFPDHGVAVELDGRDNHHSDPQLLRDAERDLRCRALGLVVIRYRRAQLRRTPVAVAGDLRAALRRSQPTG